MSYDLHVPTVAESQCTGFLGAAEKTIRNRVFRVAFWSTGETVRCTKDCRPVGWMAMPHAARKMAREAARIIKAAHTA